MESLQIWRFRWFILRLYAVALIISIIAAAVIVVITKNALPGGIPGSLLLAMRPIIKWAFSRQTST